MVSTWLTCSFTDYLRPIISRIRVEPRSVNLISSGRAVQLTAFLEIFLPSYVECDFESLERKRDPVHEIRLSDEEIKQMFPQ
jgi:hypothetical protein